MEIRLALAEETGTVEARRDLSLSYNRLGDIARTEGQLVKARGYYKKGLELALALAKESPTLEHYDDVTTSCYYLSTVVTKTAEKKAYLTKAIELCESLIKHAPSNARYQQKYQFLRQELAKL